MTQFSVCQSQSKLHSVHPPPPPPPLSAVGVGGEVGLSLQPNFKKGELDRTSTFTGGLLGKRGVTFFGGGGGGGVQLSHNKLKSEIFDDKKSL